MYCACVCTYPGTCIYRKYNYMYTSLSIIRVSNLLYMYLYVTFLLWLGVLNSTSRSDSVMFDSMHAACTCMYTDFCLSTSLYCAVWFVLTTSTDEIICMYAHVCTHARTHARTYAHMHTHTHTYMHTCMYTGNK